MVEGGGRVLKIKFTICRYSWFVSEAIGFHFCTILWKEINIKDACAYIQRAAMGGTISSGIEYSLLVYISHR